MPFLQLGGTLCAKSSFLLEQCAHASKGRKEALPRNVAARGRSLVTFFYKDSGKYQAPSILPDPFNIRASSEETRAMRCRYILGGHLS